MAKSIVDKVDTAYILSRPTARELKLLEPILRSAVHFNKPAPNICMSVYKNRGGKYTRVKIWLYVDYDTMRVHDQFCTDYEYKSLPIPQTYIEINEDQEVKISNDKRTLTRNLNEATFIMNQIEDDGSKVEDFTDVELKQEPESELDLKSEDNFSNKEQEKIKNEFSQAEDDLPPWEDGETDSEEKKSSKEQEKIKNNHAKEIKDRIKKTAQKQKVNKSKQDEDKKESQPAQDSAEFVEDNNIKFVPTPRKGSKYTAADFDW